MADEAARFWHCQALAPASGRETVQTRSGKHAGTFWERQGTPLRNNFRAEIDARCDLFSLGAFFRDADRPRSVSGRIVWRDSALRFAGSPRAQRVTAIVAWKNRTSRIGANRKDRYAMREPWPRSCAPPCSWMAIETRQAQALEGCVLPFRLLRQIKTRIFALPVFRTITVSLRDRPFNRAFSW